MQHNAIIVTNAYYPIEVEGQVHDNMAAEG